LVSKLDPFTKECVDTLAMAEEVRITRNEHVYRFDQLLHLLGPGQRFAFHGEE
jgi:hypothetical protein